MAIFIENTNVKIVYIKIISYNVMKSDSHITSYIIDLA